MLEIGLYVAQMVLTNAHIVLGVPTQFLTGAVNEILAKFSIGILLFNNKEEYGKSKTFLSVDTVSVCLIGSFSTLVTLVLRFTCVPWMAQHVQLVEEL